MLFLFHFYRFSLELLSSAVLFHLDFTIHILPKSISEFENLKKNKELEFELGLANFFELEFEFD